MKQMIAYEIEHFYPTLDMAAVLAASVFTDEDKKKADDLGRQLIACCAGEANRVVLISLLALCRGILLSGDHTGEMRLSMEGAARHVLNVQQGQPVPLTTNN